MNAESKSRGQSGGPKVRTPLLGTRGSELALVQARIVAETLEQKCGIAFQTEIIRTSGDESGAGDNRKSGRKGLFTAELERALIREQIDLAVHSAKDLPSTLHAKTKVAATLRRGAVEDVLITKTQLSLGQLREGATVATGSVRRQRQLRWLRPDLEIIDLRGNVPTRLRKFIASDWDAIILARAGLERLGFLWPHFQLTGQGFYGRVLPVDKFVPAGGQGIIAVQTRADDSNINDMVSRADDPTTHLCLRAEREFLRLLEGDCDMPVGVLGTVTKNVIELRAQFFGKEIAPRILQARGALPEAVAADVYSQLNAR